MSDRDFPDDWNWHDHDIDVDEKLAKERARTAPVGPPNGNGNGSSNGHGANGSSAPDPADVPAPLFVEAREFFSGDEADDDIDEPMLVQDMLPIAAPVFSAGLPESRKTTIKLLMGICIGAGLPFLGHATLQGPVALVLEEDNLRRSRSRLRRIARGLGLDVRELPLKIAVQKGIRLDDEASVNKIIAAGKGAVLIVVDSLARVHLQDENDRTGMAVVTRALTRITIETGATVDVIHHMRKKSPNGGDGERPGQRMRGSGDLHALARATMFFEKLPNGTIKIGCEGNYTADLEPLYVNVFEGERDGHKIIAVHEASNRNAPDADNAQDARASARCDAADTAVLEVLAAGPHSSRQVRALLKGRFGHDAISDALARLELADKVDRGGPLAPKSNTRTWRLKPTGEQLTIGAGL